MPWALWVAVGLTVGMGAYYVWAVWWAASRREEGKRK